MNNITTQSCGCSTCTEARSNFNTERERYNLFNEASETGTSFNNRTNDCDQHVHEFIGSTLVAERRDECHNHRFATVSEEAIATRDSHVHRIWFRTDSHDGHFHEFCGISSPAIWVGDGRHVHFLKDCTESADGHVHRFRAASLIDDPTEDCR